MLEIWLTKGPSTSPHPYIRRHRAGPESGQGGNRQSVPRAEGCPPPAARGPASHVPPYAIPASEEAYIAPLAAMEAPFTTSRPRLWPPCAFCLLGRLYLGATSILSR